MQSTFSRGFGPLTDPLTCEAKYLSYAVLPEVREFWNGTMNLPLIILASYSFYNSSIYYKGSFNSLISFSLLAYGAVHSLYCFLGHASWYHFRTVMLFWFVAFQCFSLTDLWLNKWKLTKTFALLFFFFYTVIGMFTLTEWSIQNWPMPLLLPNLIVYISLIWIYRRRSRLYEFSSEHEDSYRATRDALNTQSNADNIRFGITQIFRMTLIMIVLEVLDTYFCFSLWCAYIPFTGISEVVRAVIYYDLCQITAFVNAVLLNQVVLFEVSKKIFIRITWLSRKEGTQLDRLTEIELMKTTLVGNLLGTEKRQGENSVVANVPYESDSTPGHSLSINDETLNSGIEGMEVEQL